jgi:hypothetical protein
MKALVPVLTLLAAAAAVTSPPVAAAADESQVQTDFMPGLGVVVRSGTRGYVTLACQVARRGFAEHCEVTSEWPQGKGLGRAALKLQPDFEFTPAKGPDPVPVSISVAFRSSTGSQFDEEAFLREYRQANNNPIGAFGTSSARAEGGDGLAINEMTQLQGPVWAVAASADDVAKAYPAKGGGVAGQAVTHCHVRANGALDACQLVMEAPEGHDFGKAALGLAAKFHLDPTLMAQAPKGIPVWVDIPIRLQPPGAAS